MDSTSLYDTCMRTIWENIYGPKQMYVSGGEGGGLRSYKNCPFLFMISTDDPFANSFENYNSRHQSKFANTSKMFTVPS